MRLGGGKGEGEKAQAPERLTVARWTGLDWTRRTRVDHLSASASRGGPIRHALQGGASREEKQEGSAHLSSSITRSKRPRLATLVRVCGCTLQRCTLYSRDSLCRLSQDAQWHGAIVIPACLHPARLASDQVPIRTAGWRNLADQAPAPPSAAASARFSVRGVISCSPERCARRDRATASARAGRSFELAQLKRRLKGIGAAAQTWCDPTAVSSGLHARFLLNLAPCVILPGVIGRGKLPRGRCKQHLVHQLSEILEDSRRALQVPEAIRAADGASSYLENEKKHRVRPSACLVRFDM